VKHVVAALEGTRSLERQDVQRLLDDAQARVVAHGVGADGAQRSRADIEATLAEDDVVADRDERGREGASFRVRSAQEVVRQPLCGLGPDARQARKGLDEPGNRLD